MVTKEPMKKELLDKVSGGVEIGIPSGNSNVKEYNDAEIASRWEAIKSRMEWEFKNKELELKAKQMWIDAGLDLAKNILPNGGTVVDYVKKIMGGAKKGGEILNPMDDEKSSALC